MLVLSRKTGEDILIGDDIVIAVVEIGPGRVKIGVRAPSKVAVDRREVRESKTVAPRPAQVPKCRSAKEVMAARRNGPGGSGCCNRYADNMACDCLEQAISADRTAAKTPPAVCTLCGGLGWTNGGPQNGWNKITVRCPNGCPVRCEVCGDPNCDNPSGQH